MLTKASFDEWCRSQENGYDAWMAWQEAAKRENSECAKVCEDMAKRRESGRSGYEDESRHNRTEGAIDELYFAAAAIRARG
jgi:hypothetical protein